MSLIITQAYKMSLIIIQAHKLSLIIIQAHKTSLTIAQAHSICRSHQPECHAVSFPWHKPVSRLRSKLSPPPPSPRYPRHTPLFLEKWNILFYMFSRHIRSRQIRCFVCERGIKQQYLWSLTSTNPYVVTERVEVIVGLMYAAISGTISQCLTVHRIQAACGYRTLCAGTARYRLCVDTEHCVRAQQDTGYLWTQNTVGRHSRIQAACGHRTLWAGTAGYRLPVDTTPWAGTGERNCVL
jgi:hypothetical protein